MCLAEKISKDICLDSLPYVDKEVRVRDYRNCLVRGARDAGVCG